MMTKVESLIKLRDKLKEEHKSYDPTKSNLAILHMEIQ